ncbi:DUF6378 domain-containing protein [Falsirhodobacter sp. 20TX0035]|uniref:DUF6378 domain-containing protein n=1 Tax=Falsirhodobacter sp. 20TX0035 TaxID=3022019 RepID=UPI00232A887D|nr:DUF6378 domain-containing protein [Falsirhodobacter sp. 20TX0035]MDB6454725.1 DUF6378 domain-containing protein [Falsirhodobacter sp. 20TX0035]
MKRTEILSTASDIITTDRNTAYGEPEDSFGLIAAYWSAHLDASITSSDVAVMMALLKIARIKSSPEKSDHWVDLAGYAACGGEIMTEVTL